MTTGKSVDVGPDVAEVQSQRARRAVVWFPYVVTAIVAVCLVVMNSRGLLDDVDYQSVDPVTNELLFSCNYQHGWPMEWLDSDSMQAVKKNAAQGLKDSWLFHTTPVAFHHQAIIINVLVGVLILAVVFLVARFRMRRQNSLRVSLFEILLLVTLASICFAHYQSHRELQQTEMSVQEQLSDRNFQCEQTTWRGPAWLRCLLGDQSWMNVFRHVESLSFDADKLDDEASEKIAIFQYAKKVFIRSDPSRKQIEYLSALKRLEEIEVKGVGSTSVPDSLFSGLGVTDNARAILRRRRGEGLTVGEPHASRMQKANVVFPRVQSVIIFALDEDRNRWPRALDIVGNCPNLKHVSLQGLQFIGDDLMGLPRTIEHIEYGIQSSNEEFELIESTYPMAKIERQNLGWSRTSESRAAWKSARTFINRRRALGWERSRNQFGVLDLSTVDVDEKVLHRLEPLF